VLRLVGTVPIPAVGRNQLHQRIQRGRGMAVTGIVLGVLWLLAWAVFVDLRPSFIYPQDAYSWRGNREIVCVVEAAKGTTTGTALR
jgi:hypothetical protein